MRKPELRLIRQETDFRKKRPGTQAKNRGIPGFFAFLVAFSHEKAGLEARLSLCALQP
jgi:hypothetical protein